MGIDEALAQMEFNDKKGAKIIKEVCYSFLQNVFPIFVNPIYLESFSEIYYSIYAEILSVYYVDFWFPNKVLFFRKYDHLAVVKLDI